MAEKKLGRTLGDILSNLAKINIRPNIEHTSRQSNQDPPIKDVITPRTVSIKEPDIVGINERIVWLKHSDIVPNRFQPRKEFNPEELKELSDSIKISGVIQPILVRSVGALFELIAGERRWRACGLLNLDKVPAILKQADDKTVLEWAIIENTQRKDLNPIEKAKAYKQLAEMFSLKHEDIAGRMGIDRSSVSNFLRLLELPTEVQEEVSRGTISMGHARTLLALAEKDAQIKVMRRIKKEGMSVRRLEYVIRYLNRKSKLTAPEKKGLYLKELEDRLRKKFGTKISITAYKSKGYISIAFFSNEDFQRILDMLEK
jgi:ParB family chromosome partitioning protein